MICKGISSKNISIIDQVFDPHLTNVSEEEANLDEDVISKINKKITNVYIKKDAATTSNKRGVFTNNINNISKKGFRKINNEKNLIENSNSTYENTTGYYEELISILFFL